MLPKVVHPEGGVTVPSEAMERATEYMQSFAFVVETVVVELVATVPVAFFGREAFTSKGVVVLVPLQPHALMRWPVIV